ncbi:uncharacterized protein METZ01_LOCUS191662, partial [marine metagenome]
VSGDHVGHYGDRAPQILIGYKPVAEIGGLGPFPVGLREPLVCPFGAVATGKESSTQGGVAGVDKYAKGIWVAVQDLTTASHVDLQQQVPAIP